MAGGGAAIVAEAQKFLGHPYVYGAEGPTAFDCSGLVQYVLGKVGIKGVPRTSEAQYAWAQKISRSQLQPGDLVFSQWPGDNASPGHVGIYVGGGKILDAEDPANGVRYSSLAAWGSHVVGYGRAPGVSGAAVSGSGAGGSASSGLWPSSVTGFFDNLDHAAGALWGSVAGLFSPTPYIRAAAGLLASLLLIAGLWFVVKAAT